MSNKEKEKRAAIPFFGIPRVLPFAKKYRKQIIT